MSASQVIESLALDTFALAFVTWRMASATREMARSSEQQLELLRRQAEAAETANQHAERQLSATATPRLMIERRAGEEIVGGIDEDNPGRWTGLIRNVGQTKAEIVRAQVNLAPARLTLTPVPSGPIGPSEQRPFAAEAPADVLADGGAGTVPFPTTLIYAGPKVRRPPICLRWSPHERPEGVPPRLPSRRDRRS